MASEKNGDLTPMMLTPGSGKRIWWRCDNGHEWQAYVHSRRDGDGCPFCSGHRVAIGFNDLASKSPILAAEWHPNKNGNIKPTDVTMYSNKRAWWVCQKCGYEWEASINGRGRGNGCPACAKQKRKNSKK